MAAESSSSTVNRRRGLRKPPLITCPDCHQHRVVECKSNKPWSQGDIFYTCPDHNADGTGCPFFRWEAAYIKHLEKEAAKEKASGMQSDEVPEGYLEKIVEVGKGDGRGVEGELRTLISLGYDIAGLLKCIVCLCFVIVAVQLLLVVVHFNK